MREPRLDLRGLAAFAAVAQQGSVAQAAAALGWSHPTVDHHVRGLERALGADLVERTPRGSFPTPTGLLLVARATEILELCDRTVEDVAGWQRTAAHRVRFGAFPTMGTSVVPDVHARLAGGSASLEITLDECSTLIEQLRHRELDLALLYTMAKRVSGLGDEFAVLRLFTEDVYLAVGRDHRLLRDREREGVAPGSVVRLEDVAKLRDDRWGFGVSDADAVDAETRAVCRLAGFEPETGMRTDDYPAVLSMVAAGLMVGAVPGSALSATASTGIALIPFPRERLRREVVLAVRRRVLEAPDTDAHSAAIRQVIQAVQRASIEEAAAHVP